MIEIAVFGVGLFVTGLVTLALVQIGAIERARQQSTTAPTKSSSPARVLPVELEHQEVNAEPLRRAG